MTDAELQRLLTRAAAVLRRYGATEVYLFGSAAKGKMHAHSDIDLAVLGLPAAMYYRAVGEILLALKMPVDVVTLEDGSRLSKYLLEQRERGELRRVA